MSQVNAHFRVLVLTITLLGSGAFAQMLESDAEDPFKSIDDITTPEYIKKEEKADVIELAPVNEKTKSTSAPQGNTSPEMSSRVTLGTYIEFGNDAGGLHATYAIDDKSRTDLYISTDFKSIMIQGGYAMINKNVIKSGNVTGDLYWGPQLAFAKDEWNSYIRVGLFGGAAFKVSTLPGYSFFINLEPSSTFIFPRAGSTDFDLTTHALKFGVRYFL
ncbi:MAG: hypothetical protein OCC49_14920 [Fibrobacterales bacterium]